MKRERTKSGATPKEPSKVPEKKTKKVEQVKKSPGEKYQDFLNEVYKREGGIGFLPIRGLDADDEGELQLIDLTAKQVNKLRNILLTKRRNVQVHHYEDFATDGQGGEGITFSNTSTGNNIILKMPNEIKKILKKSPLSAAFDALLGLTYNLHRYDSWISDNECYDDGSLKKAVLLLGASWRGILSKTNQQLGIDVEVTLPGVESLLEQLAEKIHTSEAVTDYGNYKFIWRP